MWGNIMIYTFLDCEYREYVEFVSQYAELNQFAYICHNMSAVKKEYKKGCAYCLKNLDRRCCPMGYVR